MTEAAPRFRLSGDQVRLLVIVVMVAGFALFSDTFFSVRNFADMLTTFAVLGILSAGLLVVLVAGEIDISFAAVMTVAEYVAAWTVIHFGGNWLTLFATAIAVAVALECFNALLVHYLRAMSIIVTIATLNLFYGLVNFVSHGEWLYNFPDWFMDGVGFTLPLPGGGNAKIGLAIIALAITWLAVWLLLSRLTLGRRLYAVGGSRESAHHVGFSILGARLAAFATIGVAAGIAAVVHAQLVQTVAPNALVGLELEVLTAVVLGGASLAGGVGTFAGMVCGVAFVALIKNGMTILRVDSYYHTFLLGLLILVSVTVSNIGDRIRAGGRGNP